MHVLATHGAPAMWLGWLALVGAAWLVRSRTFAIAAGVFLGIMLLIVSGLARGLEETPSAIVYAGACLALLHFATLLRPRLRPRWFRVLVSIPGMGFLGGALLAFPWAIAGAFGLELWFVWVPFALSAVGMAQVFSRQSAEVALVIDDDDIGELQRHRSRRDAQVDAPSLSIVQITDPHLGPLMSPDRLRSICERATEASPDLVFITGDLLTMESQGNPEALAHALAPLSALEGRVFACMGNHDYEAPDTVRQALAQVGATLLVDEVAHVESRLGPVEIVGADYYFRAARDRLAELFRRVGPRGDAPRLLLLHNPAHFAHVPSGSVDLVLSGHTHGGQLGLVSVGLSWTVWNALSKTPDHGTWACGRNRLYVHRGTGHYGFPVRIGVPREESVLRVTFARMAA